MRPGIEGAGRDLTGRVPSHHQQIRTTQVTHPEVPPSGVEPMSVTPTAPSGVAAGPRRVRHQARDAVVLMAFSATTSIAVATGFLLLAHLGHAGR